MSKIVVIDYGIGNVFSVCNALRKIGEDPLLTNKSAEIAAADRIILPGVGAFGKAVDALKSQGFDEVLKRYKETGRPFMGICVGMQMAMSHGTEFGDHDGLGYVDGVVARIPSVTDDEKIIPVPHISWGRLVATQGGEAKWNASPLGGFQSGAVSAYFVHSYHCVPEDKSTILAETEYGGHRLTAAIGHENFIGLQFHPERSGEIGQRVLKRFMDL
ncbi:MAG: imidazole glycerol phosphate synthase subunit HisH 1 [Hyphococcus sp.]|nr:MAG: imidazole glycerol phosphate synthase subunit HisH 1 [Marinicaulis sp.]